MSGATTELNLSTAVDSDDNADYLTIALANSLRTVDSLFNNVTGHTHSGAHQGGPITLQATNIPNGLITSAMIADGTIATGDIADGAVTSAKIADGTITTTDIADGTITATDIAATAIQQTAQSPLATPAAWSNAATGSWMQTSLSIGYSVAVTGLIRVEISVVLMHSVANASFYFGVGVDGANPSAYWAVTARSLPNGWNLCTGVAYLNVALGGHNFFVVALNNTAGTLSFAGAGMGIIAVTEQKR